MPTVGIPAGGFKTVGQIVGTNAIQFHSGQDGMAITIEMLSAHVSGAPVVDHDGTYVGFISEVDILTALAGAHDLNRLTAEQLMVKNPISVRKSTPIAEAIQIMADKHLLNLPVEENGRVTYSVTRHDLLRASVGMPVDIEE
ncbi:MAG: CBS domain-containing protein [Nitrospira sp.]|nr:MAG: CBS domain-containing protein [Nitrospira sp.]